MTRRRLRFPAALALTMSMLALPAHARGCPPASVGGPTIGAITVGGSSVSLKSVSYAANRPLDPPPTNRAAGFSRTNAPLGAEHGTSVIAWHVRYGKGCPGVLNDVLTLPIGTTFTVGMRGETPLEFVLRKRLVTSKTELNVEWFRHDGPYELMLFTCGDLRNGVFRKTWVMFAEPVAG